MAVWRVDVSHRTINQTIQYTKNMPSLINGNLANRMKTTKITTPYNRIKASFLVRNGRKNVLPKNKFNRHMKMLNANWYKKHNISFHNSDKVNCYIVKAITVNILLTILTHNKFCLFRQYILLIV